MNSKLPRYQQIHDFLKKQIQQGDIKVGEYLPSENELCTQFTITRTTARKALEELQKQGFIDRIHGKGSVVKERRQTLGLLNVKGFSEAVGKNVRTVFLENPHFVSWPKKMIFPASKEEQESACIFFKRLRYVGDKPIMLEKNWFSGTALDNFINTKFIDGSFFKTLSQKYLIEIVGSEHELRAEYADEETAKLLGVNQKFPVLHISIKFSSSDPNLNIYSELYCNTKEYPIANQYHL